VFPRGYWGPASLGGGGRRLEKIVPSLRTSAIGRAAVAARESARRMGRLSTVGLSRRTGDVSPVSGRPAFASSVAVECRVTEQKKNARVRTPRELSGYVRGHRCESFGVPASPGDRVRYDGTDYTVREVSGVLEDTWILR